MASQTRLKGMPRRLALLASSVPAREKATTSIPLSTMAAARDSSMCWPQVVVDTAQPARRATLTKSMKRGCRKGSPQPCRWTRPHWRMSGQRAAKVSALMRRDCQTSFLVVCGQ